MIGNLYIIRNTVNDKVYIGKTYKNIDKRFAQHKNDMNKFASYKFYKAMKKHGVDKFYIEFIGKFEEGILEEKEIEYIARYDSFHNGYNSTLGGDGKRLLELDEKEVVNYWKTTESIAKTATFFDVSSDTITKILVSNGVYERVPVSERIPLVMYDKLWNRIKFFTCRKEAISYIKNELHMGIPFSICQRLDEANAKNNIAFEHHWQKYNELFYENKEFNTRYDKEQFLNGKDIVCINNIWFVKEREELVLNIETGKYEKPKKEPVILTIRPEKENLENFKPFTVKDIAEYYHVTEHTVRKWFRFY